MRTGRRRGVTMIELITVISLLGALSAILLPRYWRTVDSANYEACRQNLHNLGTSIQVWANDHDQRFPASLSQIVPVPLGTIPTCPAARKDTYGEGYSLDPEAPVFTIACKGRHHAPKGVAEDQPFYVYGTGLGPNP